MSFSESGLNVFGRPERLTSMLVVDATLEQYDAIGRETTCYRIIQRIILHCICHTLSILETPILVN